MRRSQRPPEALSRASERPSPRSGRIPLDSAPLFCGLAVVSLCGCATVTSEDPPSHIGGSGAGANQPSRSGGSGGTAPLADLPAPVATTPAGPPGPIDTNPGGGLPPVVAVSNGGSASTAPAAVDAGRQFPTGMTLLEENFENFQAAGGEWATSQGSIWGVATDPQLVSNVYTQTETTSNTPDLATAGDVTWRDVVVESDMQILGFNGSSSSYMAGLCVRVRDAENFYLIGLRSNDGKMGLRRYANGGTNLVQSTFDQGTTGKWYHLRVEVIGSTITAFLDDALMFSETDTTHAAGGIALCTVRASASFDNVRVSAP
jgi:hypothetical protein